MFTDSNQNKATARSVNNQTIWKGRPVSIWNVYKNTGICEQAFIQNSPSLTALLVFFGLFGRAGGITPNTTNSVKIYCWLYADTAAPLSGDSSCTNECFRGLIHLFGFMWVSRTTVSSSDSPIFIMKTRSFYFSVLFRISPMNEILNQK